MKKKKHTHAPSIKYLSKNILIFLLVFLVVGGLFSTYSSTREQIPDVDVATFLGQVKKGEVQSIVVENDQITAVLNNGTKEKTHKEIGEPLSDLFANYGVTPDMLGAVPISIERERGLVVWLGAILPFFLPLIIIGVFLWFMMRSVQGANTRAMMFGQSAAREVKPEDKKKVTFKDIAGIKEAKEELEEIVEFLKNTKKFTDIGAKIPKGVLLMGPPGSGKTLLARAVAGEADVPFFHISGSEFVEMFVGVGAARVRSLFERAKKGAPCIIFIDEIDAVGRQRGSGLGGSHDEREQTLNQILVEMDGFDPNIGVIVLAATNRPDVLDPALLRPGRFDRRVTVDLPDIEDREAILNIHAANKPMAKGVSIRKIAERTPGFSGADLANLMNEAAILTARRNKKAIGESELVESVEKVMLGPERKSYILNERERKVTAYHEGGHALVAHLLPHADPVHKISIISRGRAAGYTIKLPSEDKKMQSRQEFIDNIAVMVGGYVVEKEIFDDVTTGASSDLQKATHVARELIMKYGMAEKMSPRTFSGNGEHIFLGREISEARDYSEKTAEAIDKEVDAFIAHGLKTAKEIITTHRGLLDRIATTLLEKEKLERGDFEAIVGPKTLPERKIVTSTASQP